MKRIQRIISFLLALVMVIGMLPPMEAHAEETQPTEETAAVETVAEETVVETTTAATESVMETTEVVRAPVEETTMPTEAETEPMEETTAPAVETIPEEIVSSNAMGAATTTSGTCGDELTWILEDGIVTISGTGRMDDYLTSRAPWYEYRDYITKVVIEYGVSSISRNAFCECKELTEIYLPDSIIDIGQDAFYLCVKLVSVNIPNSVSSIGKSAFAHCYELVSINIGDSVTSIEDFVFSDCGSLTTITVGKSVTYIGAYAFSKCSDLTAISLPDGVTSIGYHAFYCCENLMTVTIPDNVASIGSYAFYGCSSLTDVKIPDGVTTIEERTFSGCNSLVSVTIGSGTTSVERHAFSNCSNLTTVFIPDSVTKIGDYAFQECVGLVNLTIGNSVTSIGSEAFSGCKELTTVVIPDSVKTIYYGAFLNCQAMVSATIGEGITSISNCAFSGCSSLKAVAIPNGLTSLSTSIFSGCTNLMTVELPDSIKTIDDSAFNGCENLKTIVIPSGVTSIGDSVFYGCKNLMTVSIPDTVSTIGSFAFAKCDVLISAKIPNGVISIRDNVFSFCESLEYVIIPDSVTSIGKNTFSSCPVLTDIYYTGSETDWTAIDGIERNDFTNIEIHYNSLGPKNSLENLTGWQRAYYDFIVSDKADADFGWDDVTYELIYLNDDLIPELWIDYAYSYAGSRIMSYYSDQLVTSNLSAGTLTYEEKANVFYHSWGQMGSFSDTVYCLTDEGLTESAKGTYNCYDENGEITQNVTSWNWGGLDVTEEWYYKYLNNWVNLEAAKVTGTENGEIYDYDGILEYLQTVKIEEPSKEENSLVIYSDYTSLSVDVGNVLTLSAGILVEGERKTDVSGITLQIVDTSIFELNGTGVKNNARYFKLKGKKVGDTFVILNDSSTGYEAKILISVYENNTHSYSLSSVPDAVVHSLEKYPSNFYNFDGLYIDSYHYSVNDDKTATVTFDVYNTNYAYGAVEVYDGNGNMQHAVLIEKTTSSATSAKAALWDNIGYIIRDFREGNLFTYRQETGYSKHTHVEVKIPENGYIKIGTNPSNSFLIGTVNAIDIIMSMSSLAGDIENYDAYSDTYIKQLTMDLLADDLYAQVLRDDIDLAKKVWKNVGKQVFVSSESMGNFVDSVINNLDQFDLGKLMSSTAQSFGWSVGTKVFTHFTGPIGAAMNLFFVMGQATDTIMQFADLSKSESSGFIYIHNQGGGVRSVNQIKVERDTDFPNETSLNVFKVDLDIDILNIVKDNEPELYESITNGVTHTYNISLLESGKEIQPGESVTVYIPIPSDLIALAYLGKTSVYRVEEDSTLTDMQVEIKDGCYVFKTDHFSLYTIVGCDPAEGCTHVFENDLCSVCGITGGVLENDIIWTLDSSGRLSITGIGVMQDFELVGKGNNPDTPWYDLRESVTEITVSDDITHIGNFAFGDMQNATSVSLPDGLVSMGNGCLSGCSSLTEVLIPSSVISIGASTFNGCESLIEVEIPDGVTRIEKYTFRNCKKLPQISIPEEISFIGGYAFYGCENLKEIDIPEGVSTIEINTFDSCSNLESVTLPEGITTIENYAFRNCIALQEIVIPQSVTSIENSVFADCTSLQKIEIPESVISIGDLVFWNCISLQEIVLPKAVVTIGSGLFRGCTTLTNVIVEGPISVLPSMIFYTCKNLQKFVIPESVTEIKHSAFANCTSLKSITIPKNVKTIGSTCFDESGIQEIFFESDAPTFSSMAFSGITTGITATVYYPENNETWSSDVMQDYGGTITWKPYTSHDISEFEDVPETAYYHDAVMWAVRNKITNGVGDGTIFDPDSGCTRAHVATFLWRAAGCPTPERTDMPFTDVPADDYFSTAVIWAAENGITTGTGDGTTFEPHATCTRGQIVTFLSRYLKGTPSSNENPFKDVPDGEYYTNAVLWAVEKGITNGVGDGTLFEPNNTCTRGMIVTFLYRALNQNR